MLFPAGILLFRNTQIIIHWDISKGEIPEDPEKAMLEYITDAVSLGEPHYHHMEVLGVQKMYETTCFTHTACHAWHAKPLQRGTGVAKLSYKLSLCMA